MIRKSALAAAALLCLLALSPQAVTPARAGVDIDIGLNLGYGGGERDRRSAPQLPAGPVVRRHPELLERPDHRCPPRLALI